MTSSPCEDIDSFEMELDLTDEASTDDCESWFSSPKRQPDQALCTRWDRPKLGIDNFS